MSEVAPLANAPGVFDAVTHAKGEALRFGVVRPLGELQMPEQVRFDAAPHGVFERHRLGPSLADVAEQRAAGSMEGDR
jgi:hypothetical protein